MTDIPWEPPLAGTETGHLLGALERQRATFRWKVDGLDATGLSARLGPSTLTLGGLLKHLALVEDYKIATRFFGEPLTGWDDLDPDDEDAEFNSAADDEPASLYARYDDAVARSRTRLDAALADGGLDQLASRPLPDGARFSLRRIVFDLVEEYSRHTGHADLLRESVDGRTGEDPPDGWRPVSGHFTFRG
ncbi:DinB family protein [Actinoplanes sp. TRM 88003]|uniref:DinB family protein n=1 Tax=Paractinoplanes aksuensis TaxID=2939490 RepID=A0ABT1DW03_9ACTN|nr:DinB family protein [Actinoplanes aksuensis]MCO8274251.1 DinB family protein [Actinoplanes aksuensis]